MRKGNGVASRSDLRRALACAYKRSAGQGETFRCRWGEVYLYVEREKNTDKIKAKLPESEVSVFHEVIFKPGEQYTIMPEVKHWLQDGPEGAVISEFSTRSTDETDVFTDKKFTREGRIEE